MRYSTITYVALSFLLSINFSFSQTWEWQHPLPQGHELTDIFFLDTDTGWAGGAFGTIIKTNDGGQTWISQETPTEAWILRVFFITSDRGWAYTDNQEVLYTEDKGENWTILFTNNNFWINSHFINSEIGFITAYEPGVGAIILRTEDGGLSWNQQASFPDKVLIDLSFSDSSHGWASGQNGLIVYTENGGLDWQVQDSGTDIDLYNISFVDAQNGWAAGDQYLSPGFESIVLHTIDGGVTWSTQTVFPDIALSWFQFKDEYTGFLLAAFEDNFGFTPILYRTLDGGVTWDSYDFGGRRDIYRGFLKGDQDFWLVGGNSRILHSQDDGLNWYDQIELLTTNILEDVHFIDLDEGWATGNETLVHTSNGGESWQSVVTGGYNGYWQSIFFVNDQNGWIGGDKVLHTLNGGQDWEENDIPIGMFVSKIFFPDPIHGWIIGNTEDVLSTENGGQDWEIHTFPNSYFKDIHFIDSQTGWIIERHTILSTKDGGVTWSYFDTGIFNTLESGYFTDSLNGWVLTFGPDVFYRTQDGGETWEEKSIPGASFMLDVYFVDNNKGWVVGVGGDIWYTEDGGDTWTWQDAHTDLNLFGIHAVDAANAWAVGFNGAILKYSAEPTSIEAAEIVTKSDIEVYPNPVTDELNLIIPGPISTWQVEIRNYMGQILQSFKVVSPEASIQLEGLPQGVYFVHLNNGIEEHTKKIMILEK